MSIYPATTSNTTAPLSAPPQQQPQLPLRSASELGTRQTDREGDRTRLASQQSDPSRVLDISA